MTTSDTPRLRALIVGGSLAGLTCALALAQTDAEVTVLERAKRPRSGAALATHPGELRSVIGSQATKTVFNALGGAGRNSYGGQSVAWQNLREGLVQAIAEEPAVTLLQGQRVKSVGQNSSEAWATTEGGTTYRADLLVGADGHRSLVRTSVDPDRPNADFAGYLLWVGIAEERDLNLRGRWPGGLDIESSGNDILLGYPLPGADGSHKPGERRLGWAWYDNSRDALLASTGAVRDNVVKHSIHPTAIPTSIYRELPERAAKMWPKAWATTIADCAERRAITATPIAEYVPDRLTGGRMAIVGNAAHVPTPMTGSGFGASVDDAEALAKALRSITPDEVPTALRDYERTRLSPARELVLSGQSFSRSFARR